MKMSEAIWTVGRLIEKLREVPANLPIIGIYDFAFSENAHKKHKRVDTVTVHDVIKIKTDGSRKPNAVVIETTGVTKWLAPTLSFKKKKA
jgi:hypothetical protein